MKPADADSASELSLRLLGAPCVLKAGQQLHVLERRDAALLVWLAMKGPCDRALMAQWLWSEQSAVQAQANLRQRLFRLKNTLGCEIVIGRLRLQLSGSMAHDLVPELPGRLVAPQVLPVLLGGLNFEGCGELADWVDAEREQWRQRCLDAWAKRAEALEAEGRLAEALAWAQALAHEQRSSEHPYRRLMRLHYRRGDRAAALAAYRACEAVMLAELGVAPGLETRELAALIESSGALPAASTAQRGPAAALLRPPLLIGRETEWQALEDASRQGRWALIEGEAGIGKTRLAEDFARSVGPVQWVQAHPGDAGSPYALLARLLRALRPQLPAPPLWAGPELARLVPEFGVASQERLEPLRFTQALAAWLAPWQQRQLGHLVLDDLHWADPASLQALQTWLSQAAADLPWLLALTRPQGAASAWRSWWHALPATQALELRLGPLPAHAVPAFVESLALPQLDVATAAPALLKRTGGHPLFMLELLRQGDPQAGVAGGTSLKRMLEARLQELSAPALKLARVVALLDAAYSLELAAAVLQQPPIELIEPLQELQTAQLMGEQALAFDLVEEVMLAGIPLAIARLLHARVAEMLMRAPPAAPALIAQHWQAAGEWAAAGRAFEQAAQAALGISRRVEELALLDQAAQAYRAAALPDDAFRVERMALQAAMVVGEPQATLDRARLLLQAARSDVQQLHAELALARYQLCLADGRAARPVAERAMSRAQTLQLPQESVSAATWHGLAMALDGEEGAGLALLEATQEAAAATQNPRVQMDFHGAFGYALHSAGRYPQALVHLRRAVELAEAQGDLSQALEDMVNVSVCLTSLGDSAGSLSAGEYGLALWRRMGEPAGLLPATMQVHVGTACVANGRYAEALKELQSALQTFQQLGGEQWRSLVENRLARLYLRLGQPARARQVMAPLSAMADAGGRLARLVLQARLEALAGRSLLPQLLAAHAELALLVEPRDRQSLELMIASVEGPAESLAWCERILAAAQPHELPLLVHAGARRADALRRLGRAGDAADMACTVLAQGADGPPPLDMDPAELWCLLHGALKGVPGMQTQAGQALSSGLAWLRSCEPQVPPEFLAGFRERNPFNLALLAVLAGRMPR